MDGRLVVVGKNEGGKIIYLYKKKSSKLYFSQDIRGRGDWAKVRSCGLIINVDFCVNPCLKQSSEIIFLCWICNFV